MVGLGGCPLPYSVRVGLIDGPVDLAEPALAGTAILSHSVLADGEQPASTAHATGLVSLVAGQGGTDRPAGLAEGATVLSAVAFARDGGLDIARMDRVALALDWLSSMRAEVINLSIAGPENETLGFVLDLVAANGALLIAAAGNDGAGEVSFPASHAGVFGFTAVDAAKRLYRKANLGAGVDFAAPGVDLLVAEGGGTVHRSGTSYAAAVGTAVIAHLSASGKRSAAEVDAALRAGAEDLGQPGRDDRFGWGLIHADGCKN
jgi:hypothetical protein